MASSSGKVPKVEDISYFSIDGKNPQHVHSLTHLPEADRKVIFEIFQEVIKHHPQAVQEVGFGDPEYSLPFTSEYASPDQLEKITSALSFIATPNRELENRYDALNAQKQSCAPRVFEVLAVGSDIGSGIRNGMKLVGRVNAVATTTLGTVGGAGNVISGAGIVVRAWGEASRAIEAGDSGGTFEAIFLTGLMGVALMIVGVGMFLVFTNLATAVALPLLFKSAFSLYVIFAVRTVYIAKYLLEFRSELNAILEKDDGMNEDQKMQNARGYLAKYIQTAEGKNKLARRVGEAKALEIEQKLPHLQNPEEIRQLIDSILEENRQMLAKQLLVFVISMIGLSCYLAALPGLAGIYSQTTETALTFVTNVLWLFADQRHLNQYWLNLTDQIHRKWIERNVRVEPVVSAREKRVVDRSFRHHPPSMAPGLTASSALVSERQKDDYSVGSNDEAHETNFSDRDVVYDDLDLNLGVDERAPQAL